MSLITQGQADLHIHTTVSDGVMSPRQLLDHVAAMGTLDVIAITDHDRIEGSLWAYARRDQYPFDIVPGVEVSSAEGHILALWVTSPIPADMSMAETAAAIHEQGGVAILAHPFFTQIRHVRTAVRAYRSDPAYLLRAGLDGIEGFNAAVVLPGKNRAAQKAARTLNMSMTGGSDAHTLGAVGMGRTLFSGKTADDLRAALAAGTTQAVGRPWPLREYLNFTQDFISRRGKIVLDEIESLDTDDGDETSSSAVQSA